MVDFPLDKRGQKHSTRRLRRCTGLLCERRLSHQRRRQRRRVVCRVFHDLGRGRHRVPPGVPDGHLLPRNHRLELLPRQRLAVEQRLGEQVQLGLVARQHAARALVGVRQQLLHFLNHSE